MKLNNKGFSLIELLLAVVISTIVFGAITGLIAFSSNSMRNTNARIELQNQAKDALNHMESYALEAEKAYWDESNKLLVLFYDEEDAEEIIPKLEDGTKTIADIKDLDTNSYVYWYKEKSIYFGMSSSEALGGATPAPIATAVPGATAAPAPAPTADPIIQLVDLSNLSTLDDTTLRNYLLANDVTGFECKVLKQTEKEKHVVDVNMSLEHDFAPAYKCGERIYLRNQ